MEGIKQDCRIVLVGKTGVGKSSVGNSIVSLTDSTDKFISKNTAESVTDRCKRLQGNITSRRLGISVIDTPGLFDTKNPNNEIVTEIMKCIALAAPGPHIFLFVLSVRRFTEEERKCFEILKELFGEDVKKHTIVVFTGTDQFDDADDDDDVQTIQDFFTSSSPFLRSFVAGCGNRYVGICNKRKNPHHQRDVQQVLNLIIKTMDDNGKSFYKQKTFEKAEEVIAEEVTDRKKAKQEKEDEEVRNEIMDEIETKTESSPQTGVWGRLKSKLYDQLKSVLSIPASFIQGWFS